MSREIANNKAEERCLYHQWSCNSRPPGSSWCP